MKETRAIVVLFCGGEPSQKTMRDIYHILRMDDDVNAQSVNILSYAKEDIANSVLDWLNRPWYKNLLKPNNDKVEIKIHQDEETTPLNNAISFISTEYKDMCNSRYPHAIVMVKDYLLNEEIRNAFDIIANTPDSDLSINQYYINSKISRSFINKIREIVTNVSR